MISSLYVHLPFCSRKCLFCSFVVAVGQQHRRRDYVGALAGEIEQHRGKPLQTVYLGGGTPTVLDEDHLETLVKAIKKNFSWGDGLEMTIEANPETITPSKAQCLKTLGFDRVSLGVQSMDDRALKFLGRGHGADGALRAFEYLRQAGFRNLNVDLMYGFPAQTTEELEQDIKAIASLGSEHISLYTLTIEPRSRFYATQMKLDDDGKLAEHYVLTARLLGSYGFEQYEVSNFSKPGFQSRHNKNYWEGGPYIGAGVGAHSFDGRRRWWNTSNLQDYVLKAGQGASVVEGYEDLSEDQLVMEKVLFGLRMNAGISWDLLPAAKQAQVKAWIKDGFLQQDNGHIKATDRGRLVLDELCSRLI